MWSCPHSVINRVHRLYLGVAPPDSRNASIPSGCQNYCFFFSWCPPSNPCNQGEAYEAPALVSQLIQLPEGETNEPLGQPENQAEGSEGPPPEDPERISVVRVPLWNIVVQYIYRAIVLLAALIILHFNACSFFCKVPKESLQRKVDAEHWSRIGGTWFCLFRLPLDNVRTQICNLYSVQCHRCTAARVPKNLWVGSPARFQRNLCRGNLTRNTGVPF